MPRHWRVPPASGSHPPRLLPPSGGWVYFLVPEAPLKRGMPIGPKVFLVLPDACELRPCDRTYRKNGLVPHSCVGGTYDKYGGRNVVDGSVADWKALVQLRA